jgi:hypothetical protein
MRRNIVLSMAHMLLWGTYFGGSGFKKVYRCPVRRRPVYESVDAKDLIVSDTTKDLGTCSRITHYIRDAQKGGTQISHPSQKTHQRAS